MTDIKPVAWLCTPSAGGRPDATCRTDSRDDYVRFGRTITNLYPQSAIDALRAEVERLRADAERYRYLRENHVRHWVSKIPARNGFEETLDLDFNAQGRDLDTAIDSARSAGEGGE